MEKLKPKLFSVMKTYTKEQFIKDVISGIVVAIVALPLSIALAIASGVGPEQGIYTAIIAGFLISFFGGSRVQIAGPTAAFATIVAGIALQENGMSKLFWATIIAGVLLILMGLLKFGSLIKYIPYTITTGFTAGIAVTIAVGQLKDFFGLTYPEGLVLIETVEKAEAVVVNINTFNWQSFLVGMICLAILIIWPFAWNKIAKATEKSNKAVKAIVKVFVSIPGSLIAVVVGVLMVKLGGMNVKTIGDLYTISNDLPKFVMPEVDLQLIKGIIPDAFTIAILAAIESLLSCVVADSMVNSKHRSNMELVAQGIGNIGSAMFGGIPATGAIARTAANVKSGGRTPIAGMVHAVVLLLILVVLMPYASWIPMPTIAAILLQVAYNMSGWREIVTLLKSAPKSDILVLLVTFFLTVIFDLVVAIEVGMVLAAILFMKRMSDVTDVQSWKYIDDENDADHIDLKVVPANTRVYELSGPLFFGVADKIMNISLDGDHNCLVLRMRSVNAIDATAMRNLDKIRHACKKKGMTLILSHVNEQPMNVMKKSGFYDKVGAENFCAHIDDALKRAESLAEK
ncbi:MAG: STAS domain-containing protein [Lachnospiraceae bacterium]|nr:STAS domain-containing protein [Lachnospiraceae bacterium]